MSMARRFASQALPRKADAVVIGSGVTGCSIAYELCKKGFRTVNVDLGPHAGNGSALQSSGVIQNYCSHVENAQLAHESVQLWKNWTDYLESPPPTEARNLATFKCTGSVLLKTPLASSFLSRAEKNMKQLGVDYEHWSTDHCIDQLALLDLSLDTPSGNLEISDGASRIANMSGALFLPETGRVDSELLVAKNLQEAAERKGAIFLFGSSVSEIMQMRGRCCGVRIAGAGTIWTPIVVNAAGPKATEVQNMAFHGAYGQYSDFKISSKGFRLEIESASVPAAVNADLASPLVADLEHQRYICLERARIRCGSLRPECYPGQEHSESSAQVTARVALSPSKPSCEDWTSYPASYDVSQDGAPIYDKTSFGGFYAAFGTGGNQFQTCGVTGRLMASLIEACENGHDHDNDPITLDLPISGLPSLSLKAFSRLRDPE